MAVNVKMDIGMTRMYFGAVHIVKKKNETLSLMVDNVEEDDKNGIHHGCRFITWRTVR